ncbi:MULTISPECIES: hypothetical protein [unclassified Microcoleus]|uniref:hypothetical protein n=1 Tax=unclassified Microcoleus TaxID=2642155 RepID=UPI002FD78E7F
MREKFTFDAPVLASKIVGTHCENYTEEIHPNLAEFWAIARSDITIARLIVGKRHCGVLLAGNIKSVSIGIIPISLLDFCVNGRQYLVRGG